MRTFLQGRRRTTRVCCISSLSSRRCHQTSSSSSSSSPSPSSKSSPPLIERMIALEWALAPWAVDPRRLQEPSGGGGGQTQGRKDTPDDGCDDDDEEALRRVLLATCPYNLLLPPTPRAPLQTLRWPLAAEAFAKANNCDVSRMRQAAMFPSADAASSLSVEVKEEEGEGGAGSADGPSSSSPSPSPATAASASSSASPSPADDGGGGGSQVSIVPFPFTPFPWLQYSAGDKRLKADAVNIVEASVGEIQSQLDGLFETLTARGVVDDAARKVSNFGGHGSFSAEEEKEDGGVVAGAGAPPSSSASSSFRNVNITYLVCFFTPTMGGATIQQFVEEVCLGVHVRSTTPAAASLNGDDDRSAVANDDDGQIVIPIVIGNNVPPSQDVGHGVPLISMPYCRAYTLVATLQELLLLPKRSLHSIAAVGGLANTTDSEGNITGTNANTTAVTVNNQIVIVSNCLNIVETAALQAQYSPRQLLQVGASKRAGRAASSSATAASTTASLEGAVPPSPPPLLEVPSIAVCPFMLHTGHGAGGAGWLPNEPMPNFNPFTAAVDSSRIEAGLMPWEVEALTEYVQHFVTLKH